jgi:hypothetical protein
MCFDSRKGEIFFSSTKRPGSALGPTQTLIQWVPWTHSLGVTFLELETDHTTSSSAKAKNEWIHTCTPHEVCNGTVYIHFTVKRGQVSTVVSNLPEERNAFSCLARFSFESSAAICRTPFRHRQIKPCRCENFRPCIRLAAAMNSGPCSAVLSKTLIIKYLNRVLYYAVDFYTRTRYCGK